MKELSKVQNAVFRVGAILLLVGAFTYQTGSICPFLIYTIGALAFASMQLVAGYEGNNLVVRRLRVQQVAGAFLLLATALFMAMNIFRFGFAQGREWVVCLSVACVLELYTAFRIPHELDKEKNKEDGRKFKKQNDNLK